MTVELMYLVWSVALTFIIMLVAVLGAMSEVGLPKLAGNREDIPRFAGWAGRATRAHLNMLESLVLFAILVLVAQAANIHTGSTLVGVQLFFWGRVAHAIIYIAGVAWLRTLAWAVSVAGLVMLFSAVI